MHVGLYPLLDGDLCWWLAADFGGPMAMLDALAYLKAARVWSVPAALEVSRSGVGAHAWVFFTAPVPAQTARRLGSALLREAMAVRGRMDLASYDRLFPSQDVLPSGGVGNLMPKVRGLSSKSIQAYRISLECFLGYLTETEGIDRAQAGFEHFDRVHLKAWLAWMSQPRHYAPRTIAPRLTAIKMFLAYSGHEDIILIALGQAVKALQAPASPRTPIEYLTEPQTRAVLAAHAGSTAKSRRNRMLLILLYDTAARVSEITELALQDLALTPPGHIILTGKRNKTRTVPISNTTIEHLRVYLAEFHPNHPQLPVTRPLFYSQHHGHPSKLSTDAVAAVLKTAARVARADCPTIPQNIHCHMLRKTKAMDGHARRFLFVFGGDIPTLPTSPPTRPREIPT